VVPALFLIVRREDAIYNGDIEIGLRASHGNGGAVRVKKAQAKVEISIRQRSTVFETAVISEARTEWSGRRYAQ